MNDKTKTSLTEVTFLVPGMMCDGCAEKVRDVVVAIPGVRQTKPSAWHKSVTVYFEASRIETQQIKSALESAGFETGEVRA
ncbi:heavy-metal-associated domain-containing protein [Methylobacterium brachiatum]|uniref:heavy-metal-associated domain-containing protein n=1 Tax=Methylobacterium brachiatum TaxID=269660 RepID=UPI000EFCA231|nr:heavy-metal-associated domain-containing protein [Methylobacterium brachiatum]AYO86641.1 copper chaperone [Methylobacterium brachiatum]